MRAARRPVVLFVHGLRVVGGDSIVMLQALEHVDRGVVEPVVVAAPNCAPWERFEAVARARQIRTHSLDLGVPDPALPTPSKARQAIALALAFIGLSWVILRERVDVVYTLDRSRSAALAALVARLLGRGLVWHAHCQGTRWGAAVRAADRVVAVSQYIRNAYLNVAPIDHKLQVIYNGVDVAKLAAPRNVVVIRAGLGVDLATPLVLLPGRLSRFKGQMELVEAMPAILSDVPSAHVVFAGYDATLTNRDDLGDLEAPGVASLGDLLLQRCAELGVAEHAHFLGPTAQMAELCAAADVIVVPSWAEPFGLVVVEGMAAAKPIVAYAAGAIPELLDSTTGVLVPLRDTGALGANIVRLLQDPAERQRLGQAAQARAGALFSVERFCRELEAVFVAVAMRAAADAAPYGSIHSSIGE